MKKTFKRDAFFRIWECFWPNSPGPLTDDWKVMDDSSINFHDVFFFIFCQIIAKMKKNTSWKFTEELSVTFQLSVSGPGDFSLYIIPIPTCLFIHNLIPYQRVLVFMLQYCVVHKDTLTYYSQEKR